MLNGWERFGDQNIQGNIFENLEAIYMLMTLELTLSFFLYQ